MGEQGKISQRTIAVIAKIRAGVMYKDIAQQYGISPTRVSQIAHKHCSDIYARRREKYLADQP
jgi:DNA-binding NarL/FixJ family response regulator